MTQQIIIPSAFDNGITGSVCVSAEYDPRIIHVCGEHSEIEAHMSLEPQDLKKAIDFLQSADRILRLQSLCHAIGFLQHLLAAVHHSQ